MLDGVQARTRGKHPASEDALDLALQRHFVDLFVARRMVSFRNFGYNTVQYTMFNLIKEIRDLDLAELADTLGSRVADLEGDFSVVDDYRLHQRNSSHVRGAITGRAEVYGSAATRP